MVRRGWGHADLMAMEEAEFCFWAGIEIEAVEAEAQAAKGADQ